MEFKVVIVGASIVVVGAGGIALCRWLFRALVRSIVEEVRRQINGGGKGGDVH